ncbi:uncharacterized protein DSM5745_02871 [Aspergillus mulundensis]|uniref:GPI anchored protein n=1 Tax=Aspergillus mulundensis TaxID=1810919 RepID=A0A3D8SIR8_9EURO|nr:Uncharacterized protein DSM5745_02871 [Aspergillus mulundensis]RDW86229.1 Uncharacterized protein DSM5745_02871 [Aspergillus mulundensis]
MHISKTLIPLALLAPLAAAIPDDGSLLGILTADDSSPESSYSVNPTVAETAVGAPVGVSGPVATSSSSAEDESSSTSTDSSPTSTTTSSAEPETAEDAATSTTTSIPTNILTAIDSDPTGSAVGSLTTVIGTATATAQQQSGSLAAETSSSAATATSSGEDEGSAASPTPTDDAAAAVLGSPASMLGAVLLSLAIRLF